MAHVIIGLRKLDEDINNVSENEVENRRLNYLKDLVRKIVGANQKLDEEKATQGQQGQGLKILTPKQMISSIKSRK